MPKPMEVTFVGKWNVGFSQSQGVVILSFEFSDRAPMNFAIQRDQARLIAKEIANHAATPTQPNRMN